MLYLVYLLEAMEQQTVMQIVTKEGNVVKLEECVRLLKTIKTGSSDRLITSAVGSLASNSLTDTFITEVEQAKSTSQVKVMELVVGSKPSSASKLQEVHSSRWSRPSRESEKYSHKSQPLTSSVKSSGALATSSLPSSIFQIGWIFEQNIYNMIHQNHDNLVRQFLIKAQFPCNFLEKINFKCY